jgi:hypothetical protein
MVTVSLWEGLVVDNGGCHGGRECRCRCRWFLCGRQSCLGSPSRHFPLPRLLSAPARAPPAYNTEQDGQTMNHDGGNDGSSSDDDWIKITYILSKDRLAQIQNDDPDITALKVTAGSWIKGAEQSIGKNIILKTIEICFDSVYHVDDSDWFVNLCFGLSYNSTIECLDLCFQQNVNVDVFHLLGPFLYNNRNLRNLKVTCTACRPPRLRDLASVLSKRNNDELKSIRIGWYDSQNRIRTSDTEISEIIDSFQVMNNLSDISFSGTILGRLGCMALSTLLKSPSHKICDLDIQCNDFDIDGMAILCNAINKNKTLQILDVSETDLSTSYCYCLSTVISHPTCTIKTLCLYNAGIQDDGISFLGDALVVNKTLQILELGENDVTLTGWRDFSIGLMNPHSQLKTLGLSNNDIDDEGVIIIAAALEGNTSLRKLDIGQHNRDTPSITSTGLAAFLSILKSNSTLKVLDISSADDINLGTVDEWGSLLSALCDTRSINKTHSSNHTFSTIRWDCKWSDLGVVGKEISDLLSINQLKDKTYVARWKILKYHFYKGSTGIHSIACMHESVLPHAIEWMGRDEFGYSALYDFVRGFPTLFNPSQLHCVASKKRKLPCGIL